jgi:Kef-type K+ transport system membrane component KefB
MEEHINSSSIALILIGATTLMGYYCGHIARFAKLPSLIGYMVLGVILGPSLLNFFTEEQMGSLSFITEISLGFVAFTIGSELSLSNLKRLGPGIISIIFVESFAAFFVVLAAVYLFTRDLPMALIFASMAPASAPAGTVAVIHETKSKGPLTQALYAVVGFDDGLAIIIFGFASAAAKSLLIGEATGKAGSILPALVAPTKEIILSILVGAVLGFAFCQMVRRLKNSRDILIIVFGTVVLATGLSVMLHLSLIMTNLVVGFVLVNTRRESLVHSVTAPLMEIMPLLFILFFCLAGAHLDIWGLQALGGLGVVYIIGRSFGLVGGARLGAMLGHVHENVKKYVGMGILSQAGVAIGLALIVLQDFTALGAKFNQPGQVLYDGKLHALYIGGTVITTITATCIFFEIIGPILAKIALTKAGEVGQDKR